jgi:hypothetical protein
VRAGSPLLDRRQRANPWHEGLFEPRRVQGREHPAEDVGTGDSAGQLQEAREPLALGVGKGLHLGERLGAANRGAERDRDDVEQRVRLPAVEQRLAHGRE